MSKVKKDIENIQKTMNPTKKKKNGEKKKSLEEGNKKYGYISPASVNIMAESIGINGLSEAVSKCLAEDVSYRLRSIIQLCSMYLKMTKHRKLTSRDLSEVFKMSDIPDSLEAASYNAPSEYINIREACVYIKDDPVIDLHEFALEENFVPQLPKIFLTGSWTTGDEIEIKTEPKANESDVPNHVNHTKAETNHKVESDSESKIAPSLSTNLIKYYGITCNTILGYSDLQLIHRDLSTSSKILGIIPFLLNFLTLTLNQLKSDRQILRLLQTVEALLSNNNLDFSALWPAARIGKALLLLVAGIKDSSGISKNHKLHGSASNVINYSLRMRRYAAITTAHVLTKWCRREEDKWQWVPQMGKLLAEGQKPLKIQYGALQLLIALGPDALHRALDFEKILSNLTAIAPSQEKCIFEDSLLTAINVLMRYPKSDSPIYTHDRLLYAYFGDAICCRRPHLSSPSLKYLPMPTNLTRIASQTGMKYLSSRYKPMKARPLISEVFDVHMRRSRILFKFNRARPVSEMSLKRPKRLTVTGAQFIPGKHSEGHVVLVGKIGTNRHWPSNTFYIPSLMNVL